MDRDREKKTERERERKLNRKLNHAENATSSDLSEWTDNTTIDGSTDRLAAIENRQQHGAKPASVFASSSKRNSCFRCLSWRRCRRFTLRKFIREIFQRQTLRLRLKLRLKLKLKLKLVFNACVSQATRLCATVGVCVCDGVYKS